MDPLDAVRAAVVAVGPSIVHEMPGLVEDPWSYQDALPEIAAALPRWQGRHDRGAAAASARLCRRLVRHLEAPRLPKGAGALAILVEYLSGAMPRKSRRAIWLRLAQNRRSFARRRFLRLLRNELTQQEADTLWALHCELGDEGSLWELTMAGSAVRFPPELVDEVAALNGPPFLVSRAIAHALYEHGPMAFGDMRSRFPTPSIYAVGYTGRRDFVPALAGLLDDAGCTSEEARAALWALARIGDANDVLAVVRNVLPGRSTRHGASQ